MTIVKKKLRFPTRGVTKKMINVLEQYHDGLDTKKMYHRIGKSYEELVPRFLNHCTMEHIHNNDIAGFYRPFEDPIDMDEYSPDSIFHMMYKPTLEVVPQISNSRALTLDDIFFCYNKAFGIALHALNCVERPCEYFDSYFPSIDICNRIIIMGIVYNLLKEDNDNIYMGILLDKIETELIAEAPEFLNIVISSSKSTKKGRKQEPLFKNNLGISEAESKEDKGKSRFCNVIQYEDPQALLKRLHQLIDGKKGADVGCVLLKCKQDGYIIRKPTQAEFKSEFKLIGTWQAIHNYMNENEMNALDRANKVIIFE